MNIIDVKGKTSFKAVSEIHNAISTFDPGDFGVLSNDKLVLRNIEKLLTKKQVEFKTETKQSGDFFTTFISLAEHTATLTPGVKENTTQHEQKSNTTNEKSNENYLIINSSLTTGTNLTLSKLHTKNILNEIAISGKLVSAIIFSKEAVKLLDEKNELFPILKRVIHHGVNLIADEPSLTFFAVKPSLELNVFAKTTGEIFKILCKKNTNIITI